MDLWDKAHSFQMLRLTSMQLWLHSKLLTQSPRAIH